MTTPQLKSSLQYYFDLSDTMSSSTDFGIPAAAPQKLSLTDREQEILSKAWNCMKTQPEIDYVKLAAETGMTNPRSASNAWSALKKKLFTGVPPTPRTKKATAAAAALAGDDGEATPAAKRKRTPAKKKVAPVDDGADDMDIDAEGAGDATPTKKKRAAPRKKATPAKVAPKTEDEPEEAVKEEAVKTETVKEEASQTESEAEKTKVESVTDEI
ncbi:hypothetical protein F5X68DRAFT_272767 [Plectosphaerella plurivora]|uniref:Uncharacterized protein n=1 Tax=Plectosphaerella plurivora TaxID=936078 RepID=A0A9P9AES9_9PEZI|nr:hypothetical protein F5X68DRAFT_272767 [Plectosphaerella plurivora]